jgi:hypothetical protein
MADSHSRSCAEQASCGSEAGIIYIWKLLFTYGNYYLPMEIIIYLLGNVTLGRHAHWWRGARGHLRGWG